MEKKGDFFKFWGGEYRGDLFSYLSTVMNLQYLERVPSLFLDILFDFPYNT
ncbi:hypothetical protein BREVNS_0464 [Brevinematales bacterium NS]|nr:hypothetical protein BREVNS_0464 [Brevinematales bacterium NS]